MGREGRRGVAAVVSPRATRVLECKVDRHIVGTVAGEPVDPVDDAVVRRVLGDVLDDPHEFGPVSLTYGLPRVGTLRGVRASTELGYTSLVVSYRNTAEWPRVGPGRTTLGRTETNGVDEAIGFAVRRRAQRVALFGRSMGAAIALQLADHPDTKS